MAEPLPVQHSTLCGHPRFWRAKIGGIQNCQGNQNANNNGRHKNGAQKQNDIHGRLHTSSIFAVHACSSAGAGHSSGVIHEIRKTVKEHHGGQLLSEK